MLLLHFLFQFTLHSKVNIISYCVTALSPPIPYLTLDLCVMLNLIVYSPFLDRSWQLSACSHHAEEVFAMGDTSRGVVGAA